MEDNKKYIQNRHPFSTYLALWFGLLMLTGLIVVMSGLNLGRAGVLIIIAFAAFQSVLLILFFMHVKNEYLIFKFMLGVAVFILIAIMIFAISTVSTEEVSEVKVNDVKGSVVKGSEVK